MSSEGRPAVLVLGEAEPLPAAYALLAARVRVVPLEAPDGIVPTAGVLGLDRLRLIAVAAGAWPALRLAAERPELIDKLVLVSPAGLPGDLPAVPVPTLVVTGTARPGDRATVAGASNLLVYGAGHDVAQDRPEAFAAGVGDFLEWGTGFTVSHVSQAVNPPARA